MNLFVNSARLGIWIRTHAPENIDPFRLWLAIESMGMLFEQPVERDSTIWDNIQTRLKEAGFRMFPTNGKLWVRDSDGRSSFLLDDLGLTFSGNMVRPAQAPEIKEVEEKQNKED